MAKKRNACKLLVGKGAGSRTFGIQIRKWMGNNKINLRDIGLGYMDWIDLAQNRSSCEQDNKYSSSIKLW
jgi:hypothetical protein